ncbi:hypothetical protein QBC40DRAFT_344953 [Triangularia verruculosa]|uniref:SET domain-containing protein n=1 Tax=Triangularia verruculosa TaxID=2587418 RepID=A0AAN7AXJ5_9PEZI|nr:hypothetical protein QBC40DRAFT_344953 [Triangularia verruculosa]
MRAISLLSLASFAVATVPRATYADVCLGKNIPNVDTWASISTREHICPKLTGNEGIEELNITGPRDDPHADVVRMHAFLEPPLPPPFALPMSKWVSTQRCVEQYCIHYNFGFASGRGIVAITTAQNLQRLKALEKKWTAAAAAASKQKDGFPSTASYTIAAVEGKGLGLVAKKPISTGEVIMSLPPTILVHRTFFDHFPPSSVNPLLSTAVNFLPTPLAEAFLEQMPHFSGDKINSIMQTNSFQMDLGTKSAEGGHHYGNWPEVSRFNHDCRPNVAFHIEPKTLQHVTTVVRPVAAGEELTISYLDQLDATENRKLRALHAWGFDCSCAVCSGTPKQIKKSDKKVEEIKKIEEKLSGFTDRVDKKLLERLVKLYKEERLESKSAGGLTLVALNYNMLGDAKNAVKYAKLAEEAVLREFGEGNGDVEAMRELAGDPKGHFTWRGRVGGR